MYINREISWLEFNQRVLDQAYRRELPLLERVKFLAITASNLDEFFQVRVGGLMLLQQSGKSSTDLTGLSPSEQLELIRLRASRMVGDQYMLLNNELLPLLQQAGLAPMSPDELSEAQYSALEDHFLANIAPLLTPLAMEVEHPPVLPSLSIVLGVELQDSTTGDTRFVAVVLPECLPRLVHAATLGKDGYVLLEDDTPIGLLRYNLFWDNTPFCTTLFVSRDHHGKGYGRMLMEHWERDMKDLGYGMLLTSTQVDEEAQHFYRKLGYKDCGGFVIDVPGYEQPMEMFMIKGI